MKIQKISSVMLTLAAIAVVGSAASAQVLNTPTTSVAKPFSVKVGAFFPGSGNDKKFGGATQISVGVDYALAKTTNDNPSLPSIYVDYNGGSKSSGHIDTTGIGVAIRSLTDSASSKTAPYAGAGVGVYYETGSKNDNGKTLIGVGAKVFLGAELGGGFFVEGNYQFLPSVDGINPSGFGAQVGMRF